MVSEIVASTAINNLNKLIHTIVSINHEHNYHRGFEVIPFDVGDLLRCKCSGTPSEVLAVIRKLENHDKLEIVRIKDRLDTQNEDFLINIKLNNCPLICEVQVGFKSSLDEKAVFLDHFNHFLYELRRSKFGPLCESALIIANQVDIGAYFK